MSEFSGMNNNITEFLSLLSKSLGGTRFKIHKKEPNQFGESNIKMIYITSYNEWRNEVHR